MDAILINFISKIELGELKQFENLGIIPLFTSIDHSPKYLTLKEAIDMRFLSITEVGHGGSVPELKVRNGADIPVLLFDGEEITGGKQNRILNTTRATGKFTST